jgi:hypothetical protein
MMGEWKDGRMESKGRNTGMMEWWKDGENRRSEPWSPRVAFCDAVGR